MATRRAAGRLRLMAICLLVQPQGCRTIVEDLFQGRWQSQVSRPAPLRRVWWAATQTIA